MKRIAALAAVLLSSIAQAAATLPAELELDYVLSYESIEIGRATKTLRRAADGSYAYSLWARPTGMARAFTSVEFLEQGEFRVNAGHVLPERFADIRRGDRKAYERIVNFDWEKSLLTYNDGRQQPLLPGTQDQSSLVYLFMLNPLTRGERAIPVTDGKEVETYRFIYAGREMLRTPLGTLDTIIIKRISPKQAEQELRCREQGLWPKGCPVNDFTIWLAPSKQNVAVKLQKRRKDETITLFIQAIRGL